MEIVNVEVVFLCSWLRLVLWGLLLLEGMDLDALVTHTVAQSADVPLEKVLDAFRHLDFFEVRVYFGVH